MKIRRIECNNKKKGFRITTFSGRVFWFPYANATPQPTADNRVHEVYADPDFGREALTFVLESGDEGSVHLDDVLEYNEDPKHMSNIALYRLTVEARKRVEESPLSKREICRRIGTSPTQFYRLLDTANYKKSMNQLVALLAAVECNVDFVVKERDE